METTLFASEPSHPLHQTKTSIEEGCPILMNANEKRKLRDIPEIMLFSSTDAIT